MKAFSIASLATLLTASVFAASSASAKIETWTNREGKSMEAELVSADDVNGSFRKPDGTAYLYALSKLSDADQARAKEFAAANPTTTPLTPPTAASPATAGKLTSELMGKIVAAKGNSLTLVNRDKIFATKYYAIYFSAHWCPPCRGFTPELVAAYPELKAKNPNFEIIFVSSDESKEDMLTYMNEYKMPWPGVRFELSKSLSAVQRYSGNGIPNLVFVTADGEVISSSYQGEKYVGPQKVLRDIQKKFAEKPDAS